MEEIVCFLRISDGWSLENVDESLFDGGRELWSGYAGRRIASWSSAGEILCVGEVGQEPDG